VGGNQDDIGLLEAEPLSGRLDDFSVKSPGEDVNVCVRQDASMPVAVFKRQGTGPEVGRNAFCGAVPMAVPS
jgi:hypothetical protein